MADNNELLELNENTFKAEAKEKIGDEDWDKFLWRVLADDFRIRRANPAILPQDKHRMIAHIRYDSTSPPRRNVSDVKVFEDGIMAQSPVSSRWQARVTGSTISKCSLDKRRGIGNACIGAWPDLLASECPPALRFGVE